jgi:hypothetical protein
MIELEILKLRIVPQQGKNTVKLMKNPKFYPESVTQSSVPISLSGLTPIQVTFFGNRVCKSHCRACLVHVFAHAALLPCALPDFGCTHPRRLSAAGVSPS